MIVKQNIFASFRKGKAGNAPKGGPAMMDLALPAYLF
jgi:hypothetical protein